MSFSIMSWNVAGGKFLELPTAAARQEYRRDVNEALTRLIDRHGRPEVIALQEVCRHAPPHGFPVDVIETPPGYRCHLSILVDSVRHAEVHKWERVRARGNWPQGSSFGQGMALLWREDLPHFPIWQLPPAATPPDGAIHVEEILLTSGLYSGDRDTEPRAALVAHFVAPDDGGRPPRDIFVVSLHLTTLRGEREGIAALDERGAQLRSSQLDIVLHGVVSRYNDWRRQGYRFPGADPDAAREEVPERRPPLWILCGDLNFTPEALEYGRLLRMGFVDACPNKAGGTKRSGLTSSRGASLTCDYIMVGPRYVAFDPVALDASLQANPEPDYSVQVSDHFPVFARLPM